MKEEQNLDSIELVSPLFVCMPAMCVCVWYNRRVAPLLWTGVACCRSILPALRRALQTRAARYVTYPYV